MKKIIYAIIIILLISQVYANKVPYGVDGYVKNFGEGINSSVKIINLNNNFSVEGFSNIGKIGRYSASIKGKEGDNISVTVTYEEETLEKIFSLEGLHHINFGFEKETVASTFEETIKIPEIKVLKINSVGRNQVTRIRSNSEWKDIKEYPQNIVSFAIYEDSEVELELISGEIIKENLTVSKEDIEVKKITIYDKKLLSIISIIFVICLLIVLVIFGVKKK